MTPKTFAEQEFTSDHGDRFLAFVKDVLPSIEESLAQAQIISPIADLERYLWEPLSRFTQSGGKRVRPALVLLGAAAAQGKTTDVLDIAVALELFQSAALIHDDIADEGVLRRGMPCLYRSEGTGLALNMGDAGLIKAMGVLLANQQRSAHLTRRLAHDFTCMEIRTLEGQALDLGWVRDGRWDISIDDYLYMIEHKTAYYSAAYPLSLGARAAGADEELIEALWNMGLAAGVAFQIQDDLLNLVGDAQQQGKDFRSDITEGKRTLCVLWALAHLESHDHDRLIELLNAHTEDERELNEAVSLIETGGGIEYAQRIARDLTERAQSYISNTAIKLDDETRAILISCTNFFIERAG